MRMQVSATRSHCAQQARVLLGQTTGRLLARLTIAAGLTAHKTGLLLVRFAHIPQVAHHYVSSANDFPGHRSLHSSQVQLVGIRKLAKQDVVLLSTILMAIKR